MSTTVRSLLILLFLGIPAVVLPMDGVWPGVRTFALEAAAILAAVSVFSRGAWPRTRVRAALLTLPNLFALGLLAWATASYLASPLPAVSRYELLRYAGGLLLYASLLYGVATRGDLRTVIRVATVSLALAGLVAFLKFGGAPEERVSGAFHNEQLMASFIATVLPLVLAGTLAENQLGWRLAGQLSLVCATAALVASGNRSAWMGALVGGGIGVALWLRHAAFRPALRTWIVPALAATLTLGLFLALGPGREMVFRRAGTLLHTPSDHNVQWRFGMWSKATRMIRDRPVQGWGLGLFPFQQALYYHPAVPGRSQSTIAKTGATLTESAHNSYLQIAAELGIPGLALYLGLVVSVIVVALRALPHARSETSRLLLTGGIAALASQAVTALASPAWDFPECSVFHWALMGLTLAAAGVGNRGARGESGASSAPRHSEPPPAAELKPDHPAPVGLLS